MSEEEKKTIEKIKFNNSNLYCNKEDVTFLLNLIEKQEKLIQGLNKQADELVDDYEKQLQEKNEYIFRLESEMDKWE